MSLRRGTPSILGCLRRRLHLLTITTTHSLATDLGYLLHKNPDSFQTAKREVTRVDADVDIDVALGVTEWQRGCADVVDLRSGQRIG